jgi:hypothetical protein
VTQPNDIAAEIQRVLQGYVAGISEQIETDKKEVATELKNYLAHNSPKKSGDYRKGWRVKKSGKKYIVHNKTSYQLTHLLEHGHAKRGGGRVDARVHIAPAEEMFVREFLDRVERAIDQ